MANWNPRYNDSYFTPEHGLEESRHVFVAGNDLDTRFRKMKKDDAFTILETGFGTGLNAGTAASAFLAAAESGATLNFISVEKYPLNTTQASEVLEDILPRLPEMVLILEAMPILQPGWNHWSVNLTSGVVSRMHISVYCGDVHDFLQAAAQLHKPADAVFADGHSPDRNPEMWSEEVARGIAVCCKPGATMASFTAAGQVKRAFRAAGFHIVRSAGYGVKRHMIRGSLKDTPTGGEHGLS